MVRYGGTVVRYSGTAVRYMGTEWYGGIVVRTITLQQCKCSKGFVTSHVQYNTMWHTHTHTHNGL